MIERAAVRIEEEDAACELVVGDAGGRAQLPQRIAAVEREAHELGDVVARPPRQAFREEARAPHPLVRIEVQAKEERRVVAPDPLQDFRRRLWIGPRLRVARRNLAAVRERCLEPRRLAAIDDRHRVAFLGEIPGGRHADHAGTEDQDFHGARSLENWLRLVNAVFVVTPFARP